jgi:hypothetical protein
MAASAYAAHSPASTQGLKCQVTSKQIELEVKKSSRMSTAGYKLYQKKNCWLQANRRSQANRRVKKLSYVNCWLQVVSKKNCWLQANRRSQANRRVKKSSYVNCWAVFMFTWINKVKFNSLFVHRWSAPKLLCRGAMHWPNIIPWRNARLTNKNHGAMQGSIVSIVVAQCTTELRNIVVQCTIYLGLV